MRHSWTVMSTLLASAAVLLSAQPTPAQEKVQLWYDQPASQWSDAMPLGNGRLGAMVFGTVPKEHLQLNEESLWAGEPTDVYPEDFAKNLRELRKLVLEGRISEAQKLGLAKLTGSPTSFRSYEPLADLWIEMDHATEVREYRRELDLRTGIATVEYRIGDVRTGREVLISAVDDVVAIRLFASKPGMICARVQLTRKYEGNCRRLQPSVYGWPDY